MSGRSIHVWSDDADDVARVSAVCEALGYAVIIEPPSEASMPAPKTLSAAIARMARRHKLTEREQAVCMGILAGKQGREVAADLEVSAATVKWHLHNIHAKTNTASVADLLRLAWGVELR